SGAGASGSVRLVQRHGAWRRAGSVPRRRRGGPVIRKRRDDLTLRWCRRSAGWSGWRRGPGSRPPNLGCAAGVLGAAPVGFGLARTTGGGRLVIGGEELAVIAPAGWAGWPTRAPPGERSSCAMSKPAGFG